MHLLIPGPKKSKRGIALIVSLLAIVILSIIVATFVNAYRSHYSLSRSSNSSQIAAAGCDSFYEYVVYRLEHDKRWGAQDFDGTSLGNVPSPEMEILEIIGTHRLEGTMEDLDVEFEAFLYNNISGAADSISASKARPGTVVCEVTCKNGVSTRRAEFVLASAPLFDSSILTRADLRVDAGSLIVRSLDDSRNLIRAEGDIYVPDVISTDDTRFLLPNSTAKDRKGMLWAKGDIHSFNGLGSSADVLSSDSLLRTAAQRSGGQIVSKAESHFSIYDLRDDQLQIPDTLDRVPVSAGRWNFTRKQAQLDITVSYERGSLFGDVERDVDLVGTGSVDVLEYYASPDDTVPTQVFRATHRTDDLAEQVPQTYNAGLAGTLDLDGIETNSVEVPEYANQGIEVRLIDSGVLPFPGEDGIGLLQFDMNNQRVIANSNSKIEIDGPFYVTSETTAEDGIEATPPPTLDLGFTSDGTSKAAIIARGDINIERGETIGLGALVSTQGDVRIQPADSNEVNIDASAANTGLLIYAGGDVVLRNPDETGDWSFKGLVYARNGLKMVGSNSEDVTFEGTLVALQENPAEGDNPNGIEFENTRNVEFIYNPDLLDAFVRNLPGARVQLENLVWKG